ncbi:MAG: cupin domain-containing protein [Flavobacteriales bacterium]|nr:cupin domain-containing protein [Flavobacteriales bacterium]
MKIPRHCTLFLFIYLLTGNMIAQNKTNIYTITPPKEFENILIEKLFSDSLSSSFIIWIKKEVKPHKHLYHTENILVLEGSAEMNIEGITHILNEGSFLIIPPHHVHSVKTTSKIPLKVLSVQSPEFDGTDRVQIE